MMKDKGLAKLLVESWRTFLKEGWAEDIEDAYVRGLPDSKAFKKSGPEADPARVKRAEDAKTPDDDTWDKFKQEKEKQNAQEKEKAWQNRKSTSILEKNIDQLLEDPLFFSDDGLTGIFAGLVEWQAHQALSQDEYKDVVKKEALRVISKDKKNPLNTSRVVKFLGRGAYGVVFELSNDHVLKLFSDGMFGISSDLKWYKELQDRQFNKQSEPGELAIYAYGSIPTPFRYNSRYEEIAYAEMSKIIPFEAYLNMAGGEGESSYGSEEFNDFRDFIARAVQGQPTIDTRTNKPMFKKISELDEEKYVEHVIEVVAHMRPLYGPEDETGVWSVETLKKILRAVYRLAKQTGDDYLFQRETSDVHSGNFGFNIQTGHVVVFDK